MLNTISTQQQAQMQQKLRVQHGIINVEERFFEEKKCKSK